MGDTDAVIGEEGENKVVPSCDYGVGNDKGDMLVGFCRENKSVIKIT